VTGAVVVALALPAGLADRGGVRAPQPAPHVRGVRERVFACWREVSREEAGRKFDQPVDLVCWQFAPDSVVVWEYAGELSPVRCDQQVRIDTGHNPVRMDIAFGGQAGGRTRVVPGIIRFDGDQLIWVTPAEPEGWQFLNAAGDYPTRPGGFDSTPENGYIKRVLERCALYEQVGP
jgi:hypothetical protein